MTVNIREVGKIVHMDLGYPDGNKFPCHYSRIEGGTAKALYFLLLATFIEFSVVLSILKASFGASSAERSRHFALINK